VTEHNQPVLTLRQVQLSAKFDNSEKKDSKCPRFSV
jgi:hypothetical protein